MSLKDDILAKAAVDPTIAALVANRSNDAAIAAAIPPSITTVETFIGVGKILSVLGATDGAALLDTLTTLSATNRPVYWGMKLLESNCLNVGDPVTVSQFDILVQGNLMSQASRDKLVNLAKITTPISTEDVVKVLEGN